MSVFEAPKKQHNIPMFLSVLFFLSILVFFIYSSNTFTDNNSQRQIELLERALARSITQCYALEGAYPPSLDYLKENYGLVYQEDLYFIDYEYIGSNLRPNITIIERDLE